MKLSNRVLCFVLTVVFARVPEGLAQEAHPIAPARQVWMAGVTPFMQRVHHRSDPADYMNLFQQGAPWLVSGAGLSVLKISTQMAENGTSDELRAIFAGLRSRHIQLAIEMGLISGPPGGCGKGIEGFIALGSPRKILQRVKDLGGDVDFVAMDEPIIWGHRPLHPDGSGGCQFPLEVMADQIASQIEEIHHVFPNLKVGEIEAIGGGPQAVQVDRDIAAFARLLKQKTNGAAPAFLHADIQWESGGWRPNLEQLGLQFHANHIPVGVICDGGGPGVTTSTAWIANAINRCTILAGDRSIAADQYIVQTWEPLPTKMLPETNRGALTFEVKAILTMLGMVPRPTN